MSQTSTNMRLAVHGPWSAPPESFQDAQFLRSWFEYDSEVSKISPNEHDANALYVKQIRPRTGMNWQLIFGILLVLGMSVGVWAGVAWLVAQFWK